MKTFRVINHNDLKKTDFNDLPFWVDVEGKRVWVSIVHTVVKGELLDTLTVRRVIGNKAQAPWNHYATNATHQVISDITDVYMYPNPICYFTPDDIHSLATDRKKYKYSYTPQRKCECEVDLGEPCYCKLG